MTMPDEAAVERLARYLYEESRRNVSGRPKWEHLDTHDRYDMGMRDTAMEAARKAIAAEEND